MHPQMPVLEDFHPVLYTACLCKTYLDLIHLIYFGKYILTTINLKVARTAVRTTIIITDFLTYTYMMRVCTCEP